MSDESKEKAAKANPGQKITRREMFKLAGSLNVPAMTQAAQDKGSISGTVKYPWGFVENATVRASSISTISDGSGNFRLSGLPTGAYSVIAEPPFPGYEAPAQNVEIAAGETKTVDIYLDFKRTTVDGYVYDHEGKPLKGAMISGVLCGKEMETTPTDENGYFRFDRASPGGQFIRVNAEKHMGETRDFTAQEAAGTSLTFHLTAATCKLHGIVSDKTGKPLRAEIYLSKSGIITQKTWTNADTGYYEFPVLPGTYDVLANAADHMSQGWRGEVSIDTKVDLSLDVAPPPGEQQG